MKVLVAQIGSRRHYVIPQYFYRAGILAEFVTDFLSDHGWMQLVRGFSPVLKFLPRYRKLLGRHVPGVPRSLTYAFNAFGLKRTISSGFSNAPDAVRARHLRDNKRFGELVSSRGFADADAVYCFNGAAVEVFQAAKEKGIRCILDQTSAPVEYEENLMGQVYSEYPAWESSAGEIGMSDAWRAMAEREKQEWDLADQIITGSDHVRTALDSVGADVTRVTVVPYGTHYAEEDRPVPIRQRHDRPLRVLYVGNLRLLKGIQYLYNAANEFPKDEVDFRAVGPNRLSCPTLKMIASRIRVVGPVPRSELREHYEWADVLVVPSVSEGSANVAYEALSTRLPVIASSNAGTIVEDGSTGFIVPPRSSDAIVQAIQRFLDTPEMLSKLSTATAALKEQLTLQSYESRLVAALRASCQGTTHGTCR